MVTHGGNASTNAEWLFDWTLTDGPYAFWHQWNSSAYLGFEGFASFDLKAIGNYPHEHHVVLNMTNNGQCSATNYWSGVICNSCYTTFDTYTNQYGVLEPR